MTARFIVGDVFDVLATLPDDSVDLVFSSPPFLALRSYLPADHSDKGKEIGSEATPADFLDTLLDVVEVCDRVLAPHGSLCFELGDTFSGSGGAGGDYGPVGLRSGQPEFDGSAARTRSNRPSQYGTDTGPPRRKIGDDAWPLDKSLCLIPTLFAASLAYGYNMLRPERTTPRWRIRNLVVWARPNPPVGALGDKFRPATSYLTVACKSRTRYFDLDAVRTAPKEGEAGEEYPDRVPGAMRGVREGGDVRVRMSSHAAGAPPLDYWVIPTHAYPGSHYATFPPELCIKPIKAMSPLRVCRMCGEPSRRVVVAPTELRDRHPEFAETLRAARKGLGLSQPDVDAFFGFNGMCSHWERRIAGPQSQPAYPTPEQWALLSERLSIETSEFDGLIEGFRRWSDRELDPEYQEAIDRTRNEGFYASTGNDGMALGGVNGRSMTSQHRTLGWSDCGHNDWRPGHVLDAFAGSGTVGAVATGHGRDATLIDLDARNADLALERVGPMFCTVEHLSAEGAA